MLAHFPAAGWLFSTLIIQSTCLFPVRPRSLFHYPPTLSVAPFFFPPLSIYSIPVLRRCKFITVAASVLRKRSLFIFWIFAEPHLVLLAFCHLWKGRIKVSVSSAQTWFFSPPYVSLWCPPACNWPGDGLAAGENTSLITCWKAFMQFLPPLFFPQGILFAIDSHIFYFLSPSSCSCL